MSGDQDADAAAKAALATSTAADTPSKTEQKEGEISAEATVAPSEAIEAKKKPVLKGKASSEQVVPVESKARAVGSPRVSVKKVGPSKPVEEEDTESEPEKQPKKRVKTSKKEPKTGGRRKKTPQSDDDDDVDEEQKEVERKVSALSDEIKGRFGQIAWAKMGGYPYWPCIITDPRLLSVKLQESAVKVLETKYLVFFYVSKNL